jgi:phage/plasmid-associated DNA primase
MKPMCLKTEVTKYLLPYLENDPDPTIIEKESLLLKSDSTQRRLVSQMEGHIYKKRDYEFILSHFDRKKGLFPIANNKIIDLRTLEIRNRTKEDYFTRTTECNFLEEYDKDTVLEYYSQVLHTTSIEHRDCLVKAFAYGMTGENNLKMFINLIGTADGGKSCFIEHHKNIIGSFSGMANKRIFVSQHSEAIHDSELFNLCGKRMSFLTETKDTQTFNEDIIKKISGNDCINIRAANSKETVDMKFDTVLVLATNDMCQFSDPAFMTRLWCFNFNNSFKKDASVPEKLYKMKDHYFTNLCHYAKMYYDENRNIEKSIEVTNYTTSIINKQDTFHQWNNEQLLFENGTEDDYYEKSRIYEDYKEFCRGSNKKPDGTITFYRKLEDYYKLDKAYQKTINGLKIGYVYARLTKL